MQPLVHRHDPLLLTGDDHRDLRHVARTVHQRSDRRDQMFVLVRCGNLSSNAIVVESSDDDLFQRQTERRWLEQRRDSVSRVRETLTSACLQAAGGTILWEEFPSLSPADQGQLIELLDAHPGEAGPRWITSTTCDLARELQAGRLRPDLFYRLDVFHVTVPPVERF